MITERQKRALGMPIPPPKPYGSSCYPRIQNQIPQHKEKHHLVRPPRLTLRILTVSKILSLQVLLSALFSVRFNWALGCTVDRVEQAWLLMPAIYSKRQASKIA